MRALRIALVLFFLMLCLIAWSVWMIGSIGARLDDVLPRLPREAGEEAYDMLEQLCRDWRRARPFLRAVLHRERWRAVDEQLGILSTCAAMGEEAQTEYEIALGSLMRAVAEMRRAGDATFLRKNVDRSTFLCYNSAVPHCLPGENAEFFVCLPCFGENFQM